MTYTELGSFLRQLRQGAALTEDERRRNHKRLTQQLLAERLNWSTATHISEIETNKRLPTADTLARWVNACGATEKALHLASGLAGHIPHSPMPDKDALIALLNPIVERELRIYPYPAFILDHRNVIWAMSAGTQAIYLEGVLVDKLVRPLSLFHHLFDSRTKFYTMVANRENVQRQQMIRLQTINIRHQHRPFYRNMPEIIGKYLLPADAAYFRTMWEAFDRDYYTQPEVSHARDVHLVFPNGKRVTYRPKTDVIASHDLIFAVAFLRPDGFKEENLRHADAVALPYRSAQPFRLWDFCDIQPFIDEYNAG